MEMHCANIYLFADFQTLIHIKLCKSTNLTNFIHLEKKTIAIHSCLMSISSSLFAAWFSIAWVIDDMFINLHGKSWDVSSCMSIRVQVSECISAFMPHGLYPSK